MLISTKNQIKDSTSVDEGVTAMECTICKRTFAVPTEEANKVGPDEAVVCEDCSGIADKAVATAAVVSAKVNDASDAIKTALGK